MRHGPFASVVLALVLSMAGAALGQSLESCKCVFLQERKTDPALIAQEAAAMPNLDLVRRPERIAPIVQKLVINRAADACSTRFDDMLGQRQLADVSDFLVVRSREKEQACVHEAEKDYARRAFGKGIVRISSDVWRTEPDGTANWTALNGLDETDFARDWGAVGGSGGMPEMKGDLYLAFLADILALREAVAGGAEIAEMLGTGEGNFVSVLDRLTPWAFPDWPERTNPMDMPIELFLAMLSGDGDIGRAIAEANRSMTYDDFSVLDPRPGFCPGGLPVLRYDDITVSDWDLYDARAESRRRTQEMLGQVEPTAEGSLLEQAAAAAGLALPSGLSACLAQCRDPFAASMQACEDSCYAETTFELSNDTSRPWQGNPFPSGDCEDANAVNRKACLDDLARRRDRAIADCRPVPVFGEPDNRDWTQLAGAHECFSLSAAPRLNCLRFFEERDPAGARAGIAREALREQCVIRYCGADEAAVGTTTAEDQENLKAEFEAAKEKSSELRKLYEEAFEKVKGSLPEGYSAMISSRERLDSNAHHLGGAIDIVIEAPNRGTVPLEVYRDFAKAMRDELRGVASGAQTIVEANLGEYPELDWLSDPALLGSEPLNKALSTLASSGEAVGTDAVEAVVMNTVLGRRGRVGVRMFHFEGKGVNGVSWTRRTTKATGTNLHVGLPGTKFDRFKPFFR